MMGYHLVLGETVGNGRLRASDGSICRQKDWSVYGLPPTNATLVSISFDLLATSSCRRHSIGICPPFLLGFVGILFPPIPTLLLVFSFNHLDPISYLLSKVTLLGPSFCLPTKLSRLSKLAAIENFPVKLMFCWLSVSLISRNHQFHLQLAKFNACLFLGVTEVAYRLARKACQTRNFPVFIRKANCAFPATVQHLALEPIKASYCDFPR